jgi:hypothetical protein
MILILTTCILLFLFYFVVSMIQSVVLDLCRRKNHMLDKWVEELFDIDGTFIYIYQN